jgi:hypothetical protein
MSLVRLDSTFGAKQALITTISRNIPEALFTVLAMLKKKIEWHYIGKKDAIWKIVTEEQLPRRDLMSTNESLVLLESTWKVQPRGIIIDGYLGTL